MLRKGLSRLVAIAGSAIAISACQSEPSSGRTTTTGAAVDRDANAAVTHYSPVAPSQPNVAPNTAVPGPVPTSAMGAPASAMGVTYEAGAIDLLAHAPSASPLRATDGGASGRAPASSSPR